jgi:hypothetical protein
MQLTLFLGDPSVDEYRTFDAGIVVSIDNQSIVPFTSGDVIKVGARTNTDLIVDRNFITKLSAPYGDCLDDTSSSSKFTSQYFDYIVKTSGQNYTQKYCYLLCVQSQTIKYCSCANYNLPIFKNASTHFCNSTTEWNCVYQSISKYETNISDECLKGCPFECFSIDYTVRSHASLYPNTNEAIELLDWTNSSADYIEPNEIAEAFLKFNVFFRSMQYIITTENPQMQPVDLVGAFGGLLGLFLGLSFLSFFEFFDVAWKIVQTLIIFFLNRKKINDTTLNSDLFFKENDKGSTIPKISVVEENARNI